MTRLLRLSTAIALLAVACGRRPPGATLPPPTSPPPGASPTAPASTATVRPTHTPEPSATFLPTNTPTPQPTPLPDTLATLLNTTVPPRDLRQIAMQLYGLGDIPTVVSAEAADYEIGDVVAFWAGNVDTNEQFQVDARLDYATDHVYFFVDAGLAPDTEQVRQIAETFETRTYPTNRAFFGSEWTPGVDGDPHLYILYARGLGFRVAGYFSSSDEYSRLAHEYSNEKEMFYINADTVSLRGGSIESVLAHEFQHMIQWANDSDEESWVNEGASELAKYLNSYGISNFAGSYLANPDLQLNTWAEPRTSAAGHYGAGFLFLMYILDRFGEEAARALVAHPANGMIAVDATLAELGLTDALSGQPLGAEQVFADWVVANYLQDATISDGRYAYGGSAVVPRVSAPTESITGCPASPQPHTVSQFGADYFEIACAGAHTVRFQGETEVRAVPADPHSGRYMFWGNRQDNSVARLSRAFDLRGVDAATLEYWTWFAIEEDYDYAYVEVSRDGERSWSILQTPGGTGVDPTGNNLGWGYNGFSGGVKPGAWIQERLDLTPFAGQEVVVRFEYITDDAANREGFLIEDVAVPEIGYFDDFEAGAEGWQAEGFVRIDNILPQTFAVQLIRPTAGGATVERWLPGTDQTGEALIEIGANESVVVVVSGTTLFTTEPALYELEIR